MSLSNYAGQIQPGSASFQVYKMENFEDPCDASMTETAGGIFEPFCREDEDDGGGFQCVPSDGRETAQEIVEKATAKAEAIKKQSASIEAEAYKSGFDQGEKDGFEMGTKKLEKVLDRISQVLKGMVDYQQEFIGLHEKQILGLICSIAEKVVHGKANIDCSVVRETILEAFKLAADRSEVTVKVSPDDIEHVKDLRPEFFERIKGLKSITMESDPTISPGGCVLETGFGHVDASLESQLEKIRAAVEKAFLQEQRIPQDLTANRETGN